MSIEEESYTRRRIEDVIAELDRPAYEQAISTRSLNPPGIRFDRLCEESGTTIPELEEVVAAMKAEKLIVHLQGYKHLTVTDDFRKKHGYYRNT